LIPEGDVSRKDLIDNLVASIYKQGEAANRVQNYKRAADHFLRITTVAPTSSLRPTAEYDGAVALINIEEWQGAAKVLAGFRKSFPKNELQPEVTKKLAYIYREDGKFALAAVEFERIASESTDSVLRQEVLLSAAELYEKVNNLDRAVNVYRRYVGVFPEPIEVNIETRDKLASILKLQDKRNQYHEELRQIVSLEAKAGAGQTVRTRHIASVAALVLAKLNYDECISVRLIKPFEKNLQRKQKSMKKATEFYSRLFDYEIGDVTAEATFYLAEIYADFSKALLESERPEELSALELEQYELAIEDQAYPFEEKAIEMHQSNLELLSRDVYNSWIDKSLAKLAIFMPARYDKQEVKNNEIAFLTEFRFENIALRPLPRVNVAPASEVKVDKAQTENQ
jgi:tetratricopeptide (TPR) repeat protein